MDRADEGITAVRDRLASARGFDLGLAVAIFIGLDALIALAICAAVAPHALPIVIPAIFLTPIAVGAALNLLWWRRWTSRYPAQPQAPDAVVRLNQSFMVGRGMWMNHGVHLAADDRCLHLIPISFLRWGGLGVVSLPWDRITAPEPLAGLRRGYTRATIDGRHIAGPDWCMRLAAPADLDQLTTAPGPTSPAG